MISAFAIGCFLFAGLLGAYRLLVGPSIADRIVALDVSLISLMGAIAVDAARRDDTTNLVMLAVLAIVGFTATIAASRFIEHQPDESEHEDPEHEDPEHEDLEHEDPEHDVLGEGT